MLLFKVLLMLAFEMGAPFITVESSCGAGFYSETGASECTKCAAGTYSRAGATECIQCAKGSYSGVGASRCSWCARGFYSGFGASECTKCPGDSTCTPGSTKQADCIELTDTNIKRCFLEKVDFQGSTFGDIAIPRDSIKDCAELCSNVHHCKSITFKAEEKLCWLKKKSFTADMPEYKPDSNKVTGSLNLNCMSVSGSENWCAAGSYSSADSKECLQCEPGSYSGAGASQCSHCFAGSYSEAGASECLQCAAGTYSKARASECTQCAAGSRSRAGASRCTLCAAGTYSKAGVSSCSLCATGTYSGFGASECTKCPGDSTCTPGSTKQADCIELTDRNIERCFLAKVDFHGSNLAGESAIPRASIGACARLCSQIYTCKSITFKDDEKLCWLKHKSFTPDMPDYKPDSNKVTGSLNLNCMSVSGQENWCAAGSYSSADSKECSQCEPGSYSGAGASECSQCAAGSYSEAGASECSQCPAETTSPAGSTQPSDCVAKTDGEMEISITPKKKRRKLMFKITAKRGGKKVIIPKESVKICRIFGQPDFPLTTDCEVAKMKTIYYYRQPERSPVANGDYVAIVEFGGILIQSEPITYKFE